MNPALVEYNLTATAGAGGSISPSGALMVSEGSNQTFIITPDEGYEIADVLVDGVSEGPVATYTFPNVQQDHTILASFVGLGVYNTHIGLYYYTIQEAIDAALNGETILVYPGTYYENILFDGKDITVRSTDPSDPAIVSATIIDGGEKGSVVKFVGNDTSTLKGFTIQNGDTSIGGGINIMESSPTIIGNTITDNAATVKGGGIFVYGNSSPIIQDNYIMGNEVGWHGGGIFVDIPPSCSPTIGGTDVADTGNFNTICGNSLEQLFPDNYPNNYITTICMAELSF